MRRIRNRESRPPLARTKQGNAMALKDHQVDECAAEEGASEKFSDGKFENGEKENSAEKTLETLMLHHPLHFSRMMCACTEGFSLFFCSGPARTLHSSRQGVGREKQLRSTCAGQSQTQYRPILTLTALVASALACQLAFPPQIQLVQSCHGSSVADPSKDQGESLNKLRYKGAGNSQLPGRRRQRIPLGEILGGSSQDQTVELVSGETYTQPTTEVSGASAPPREREAPAGRMFNSTASKHWSTSPRQGILEGRHGWRGKTQDSLAEEICPFPQASSGTARATAHTCIARQPLVTKSTSLSAGNTRGVLPRTRESGGADVLETHASGGRKSSTSVELPARRLVPGSDTAETRLATQGMLGPTPLVVPSASSRATGPATKTPPFESGEQNISGARLASKKKPELSVGEDSAERTPATENLPLSVHSSGFQSKVRYSLQAHGEQPVSGVPLNGDDVVVFEAPHFTTKITRHVNEPARKVELDGARVEAPERIGLIEDRADCVLRVRCGHAETARTKWPTLLTTRPVLLISRLQQHFDNECAAADAIRGGKRSYMRFFRDGYYCFEQSELDFSRRVPACVDSCGKAIKCKGRVTLDDVGRSRQVEANHLSLKYKVSFCVSSRLQARLNELCGSANQVWRVRYGVDVCVDASELKWHEAAAACVDDCGKPTRCYGVPRSHVFAPAKTRELLEKVKQQEIPKFCLCDEKVGPGVLYNGCQTMTRSGRTCQKWNSTKPHAHIELVQEDHNFCRNPYKESSIWCYTTDPQVRFDYCDPLGLKNEYIQPEEKLNVVITGRNLNPYIALRLFSRAPKEEPVCGEGLKQKATTSFFNFLSQSPGDRNLPHSTAEDGAISVLTWKDVSVENYADGGVTLCGCDYWYILAGENGEAPCFRDTDYTVVLGSLEVAGPTYPGTAETTLSTALETELTIRGVRLSVGDILTVISGTNRKDCARRNQFTVQVEALAGSSYALETDEKIVVRTTVTQVLNQGKEARSSPLRVPTTGRYVLCWNGAQHDFASTGLAKNLVVTGFNSNQNFVLVRSPFQEYSSLQQTTLYISTYKSDTKIDSHAITIQAASHPPCQGTEVGRSTKIKLLNTLSFSDAEKLLYKASVLTEVPRDTEGDEATLLDICVKLEGTVLHLGHGTVGTTYLYNFSEFTTPATLHPTAPDGVFTYQIEANSPLGVHWMETDSEEENIIVEFAPLFREGKFPKALSFWVNRVQGHITAWVFDPGDPAPDLALIWKLSNAVTVALDACFRHVHLYVITGQPAQLHVFDVSNPASDSLKQPMLTLDGRPQGFVDLCDVVLIYSTSASSCTPLILLLDRGSGFLWLYDTDLTYILNTSYLEGMSAPMSQPSSLSCTPKPSSSSGLLDTWDCVIADSSTSAIVFFRVYPVTKKIVFVQEYYGESFKEGRNTSLNTPHAVVAHRYIDKTLIYVAEAGSPDMHLLVVYPEEDVVRQEAFVSPADNVPSIKHLFIVPIHLYSGDTEDVLLATFREGVSGPQLQYGPLSTTGQIPEFFYQPREWYAVGDVHVLEPLARNGGSLDRIHEYALDESSRNKAYISSIAKIDRKTGTIRLFISHLNKQVVSIRVFGIGLVNKQVSEFTFRVACRDGYYAKEGICVKCEVGTFNSLSYVAENPETAWSACRRCPSAYSTVAEGSVSANQCQCQQGYHQNDKKGGGCVPCPPGTWKNTVADTGCQGRCPAQSSTQVTGATTPEERLCKCEPGYYYGGGETEDCIKAPNGYFSPGGYMARAISCPAGTTNAFDATTDTAATSLDSCVCKKGYTPATRAALADPTSAASLLRSYLLSFPEYASLRSSQVCVKCEKDRYKDVIGNQRCQRCPKSSYSSTLGAKSLEHCAQCAPGYYQTGELSRPCGRCPRDHFCVGSDPTIPAFVRYANKMRPCPPFSKTVFFAINDHPLKCMCRIGYELQSVGLDMMVTCVKTRLNHYKDSLSNMPGTPCPSNTVTEMTKSVSPVECICPPGTYYKEDEDECEPCPRGFYCLGKRSLDNYSNVQPTKCPPLTSTHDRGASAYEQCLCDKGYERTKLQTRTLRNVKCSPCPQNTYKDWVGDAMCRACGEHSGTKHEGATSAAQCLCFEGYYYSYTHLQCTACGGDYDKYCPGGEEECDPKDPRCVDGKKPAEPKSCPQNTRIPAGYDAASSVKDCKCEPGFGYKSGEAKDAPDSCVPCPPGYYKPSVQNTACNSLCGASATSFEGARSQSQCFCEEGTFRVGETCYGCPTGAVCRGGLLPEAQAKLKKDPRFTQITADHHVKPYAKAGFFLSKLREELQSLNDWRFTACPIEQACLEQGICVETMTEYLCSECRPNFTSNFAKGEMCTACPSMAWNISIITLYYLGVLLFNIVMTYMNVAAGFNRRSIHSIVIKIASNFVTCMSVVGAFDFTTIKLPDWAARLTTRVTQQVTIKQRVQWLSVDCLLRQGFHLSYPDSFFYTMLFYALLPIALPIIATAIMYVLLNRMQAWYRVTTKKKLDLINQAELCGLSALSEQLKERCAQDRVFLIFRYIPLPGESRLTRFGKFMEDMIPIYVTVLFFLHSPTTRQMLSLLDCTYMDFGRGHKAKYFLRAAMSVECEFGIGKPYFRYLALGVAGLCTWSMGIPLSGFMVLYMNRRNLYSRATRLKYGFLHNGFLKKYWYWETVAFARKLLVLMSTSVGLIHSKLTGDSRVWTAMLISIVFLVFHLIAQPFDKRSYLTLDRLETHSMGIWTVTCVIMAMLLGSGLGGHTNMALICILVLLVALFLLEVVFSLMIAYFDNVRAQKTFFTVPVVGRMFKFLGRLSEKRRAHEPVVIYDVENEVFQLVAAKRHGWQFLKKKADKIHLAERDYFIKVMMETLWFAVAHMKLNVIPGAFLEFILLLGMTIHKLDESSQENKKSLQAIADGDLSRLTEWSRNEYAKKEDAKKVAEQRRRHGTFCKRFGMGLHRRRRIHTQKIRRPDGEALAERVHDLEGSALEVETSSDESRENNGNEASHMDPEDDVETASVASSLPSMADGSVGELDGSKYFVINEEHLTTGIVLSELYLALLKLQQKESTGIGIQYEMFRNQKLAAAASSAERLLEKNRKLKLIRLAFQSLVTSSPEELRRLGVDEETFNRKKEELAEHNLQIDLLKAKLQDLEAEPGKVDMELEEEWVEKKDFDNLIEHHNATSELGSDGGGTTEKDRCELSAAVHHQDDLQE